MLSEKLMDWLRHGDTGSSSLTIVATMEQSPTIAAMNRWHGAHPVDPSDLWRCIKLLDLMPEYRHRFFIMAGVSEQWRVLLLHWYELEVLLREEQPTGSAPRTYRRMWDLLNPDRPRDWEAEEKAISARDSETDQD